MFFFCFVVFFVVFIFFKRRAGLLFGFYSFFCVNGFLCEDLVISRNHVWPFFFLPSKRIICFFFYPRNGLEGLEGFSF